MFCKGCGKYNPDYREKCGFCGGELSKFPTHQPVESFTVCGESKTLVGFLLGFFLGLIGLIIGICLYPSGSYERSSCLKGWIIAFVVEIVLLVILYIALGAYIMALLGYKI